jgi:tRNA(adenine34) deaminase
MRLALEEADRAEAINDVPVGCVILDLHTGEVLARGHNRREADSDPTAHAEMIAIRQAAVLRKSWRLNGCVLVVTLEPCPMCAGAIVNARIPRLIYGATDPKAGAVHTLYKIGRDTRLNHLVDVTGGILEQESADRLRRFFQRRRDAGKK